MDIDEIRKNRPLKATHYVVYDDAVHYVFHIKSILWVIVNEGRYYLDDGQYEIKPL